MSHYQQERENTMKKGLILAFALCVLFLSACGSLVATSTPATNSAAHSRAPVATASTQSVCQVLQERLTQLRQEYRAANAQRAAAQAHDNLQQVEAAEKTLIRLHQSIAQVQAQLKAC
jgi:hypothetical protein